MPRPTAPTPPALLHILGWLGKRHTSPLCRSVEREPPPRLPSVYRHIGCSTVRADQNDDAPHEPDGEPGSLFDARDES